MKPSIQLGSQENATVQYTPLKTYGEVLEVVLELHRAYYREKDDGAKHQLPNRPQLERGGTHLTTSENHRRLLSTQSECSDSGYLSPRGNSKFDTFFFQFFFPVQPHPLTFFSSSLLPVPTHASDTPLFSASRYVLVCL